jgi:hypothetical protein
VPPPVLPGFRQSDFIQLYLPERPRFRQTIVDNGQDIDLKLIHLTCALRISGSDFDLEGKVDPGAYVTVFPLQIWRLLPPGAIEWLDTPRAAKSCWTSLVGVAGGRAPARLGAIWIYAVDYRLRCLPPVRSLALFAQEALKEPDVLIGLTHGLLDDRHVTFRNHPDGARRQAWLTTGPLIQTPFDFVS